MVSRITDHSFTGSRKADHPSFMGSRKAAPPSLTGSRKADHNCTGFQSSGANFRSGFASREVRPDSVTPAYGACLVPLGPACAGFNDFVTRPMMGVDVELVGGTYDDSSYFEVDFKYAKFVWQMIVSNVCYKTLEPDDEDQLNFWWSSTRIGTPNVRFLNVLIVPQKPKFRLISEKQEMLPNVTVTRPFFLNWIEGFSPLCAGIEPPIQTGGVMTCIFQPKLSREFDHLLLDYTKWFDGVEFNYMSAKNGIVPIVRLIGKRRQPIKDEARLEMIRYAAIDFRHETTTLLEKFMVYALRAMNKLKPRVKASKLAMFLNSALVELQSQLDSFHLLDVSELEEEHSEDSDITTAVDVKLGGVDLFSGLGVAFGDLISNHKGGGLLRSKTTPQLHTSVAMDTSWQLGTMTMTHNVLFKFSLDMLSKAEFQQGFFVVDMKILTELDVFGLAGWMLGGPLLAVHSARLVESGVFLYLWDRRGNLAVFVGRLDRRWNMFTVYGCHKRVKLSKTVVKCLLESLDVNWQVKFLMILPGKQQYKPDKSKLAAYYFPTVNGNTNGDDSVLPLRPNPKPPTGWTLGGQRFRFSMDELGLSRETDDMMVEPFIDVSPVTGVWNEPTVVKVGKPHTPENWVLRGSAAATADRSRRPNTDCSVRRGSRGIALNRRIRTHTIPELVEEPELFGFGGVRD